MNRSNVFVYTWIHVGVCTFMCLCICVYTLICVHEYMCVRMLAYVCMFMCVCRTVCAYVLMSVCVWVYAFVSICMHVHMCAAMYVCTCVFVHRCACLCGHVCECVPASMCMFVCAWICVYVLHTCAWVCVLMCMCTCVCGFMHMCVNVHTFWDCECMFGNMSICALYVCGCTHMSDWTKVFLINMLYEWAKLCFISNGKSFLGRAKSYFISFLLPVLFYVYGYSDCMHDCAPALCSVLTKDRREPQIPWNRSHGWLYDTCM